MAMYNTFLGSNELKVVFRNGQSCVIEEDENWKVVFSGHFEKCVEYCKERHIQYQESLF